MTKPATESPKEWMGWSLAVLLILAAGGLGHWKGGADARDRPVAGDAEEKVSPVPVPLPARPRGDKPGGLSREACAAIRKRVLSLSQHSSRASEDWDWYAETQSLLAQLPADELAAVFGDVDQYWHVNDLELATEVLHYWVLKDPTAAMTAAENSGDGSWISDRLSKRWGSENPTEALAWAESKEVLANSKLEESKALLCRTLLSSLLIKDPDLAIEHFHKMDAASATRMIAGWGGDHGDDPVVRNRLLELAKETGRTEDMEALNASLMSSWGRSDPDAARQYLDSLEVAPAQRLEMDARLTEAGMHGDAAEALSGWMQRNADEITAPVNISRMVNGWINKDSQVALKWLADQPASAQLDQLSVASAMALSGWERYDDAVAMTALIADPEIKRKAIEKLDIIWSSSDPDAAAKWRKSISGAAGP